MAGVIVVKSDDEEYSHQLDFFYSLACSFVNCSISQYILNSIIIGLTTTLHIKSLLFSPYKTPTFLVPLLCYLFLTPQHLFLNSIQLINLFICVYMLMYVHQKVRVLLCEWVLSFYHVSPLNQIQFIHHQDIYVLHLKYRIESRSLNPRIKFMFWDYSNNEILDIF